MGSRKTKAQRTKPTKGVPAPEAKQPEEPQSPQPKTVADALERTRQKANAGEPRAREIIRKFLDEHPEVWSKVGNLARHAELTLAEAAAGGEWFGAEAIKREADRIRRALAGPSPTPLETMAVERVVLTWLQLQYVEARFMQTYRDLGWAKYWLRRQEQADKLYRSAVKSLATIRELLPAVEAGQGEVKPITPLADLVDLPLVEKAGVEGGSVNRIAGLVMQPDQMCQAAATDSADGEPKLNGHHHRLEELLASIGG